MRRVGPSGSARKQHLSNLPHVAGLRVRHGGKQVAIVPILPRQEKATQPRSGSQGSWPQRVAGAPSGTCAAASAAMPAARCTSVQRVRCGCAHRPGDGADAAAARPKSFGSTDGAAASASESSGGPHPLRRRASPGRFTAPEPAVGQDPALPDHSGLRVALPAGGEPLARTPVKRARHTTRGGATGEPRNNATSRRDSSRAPQPSGRGRMTGHGCQRSVSLGLSERSAPRQANRRPRSTVRSPPGFGRGEPHTRPHGNSRGRRPERSQAHGSIGCAGAATRRYATDSTVDQGLEVGGLRKMA